MLMDDIDYSPAAHYDRVTRAWSLLLGEELHYGVFATGTEPLAEATGALTLRMIAGAQFEPGMEVLDIGCGTGAQACALADSHEVSVVGITTSEVGVTAANKRAAEAGVADRVRFELRDGTATELPDASFDRVWILESSHLMPARDRLAYEASRVLRPGGRLVWCDIVRWRQIAFAELRARRAEFAILRAAFGDARMDPIATYRQLYTDAGLIVDHEEDLSDLTRPTFDRWRQNAADNAAEVTALIGAESLDEFTHSCDILEGLWTDRTFGYGLLAAVKPR